MSTEERMDLCKEIDNLLKVEFPGKSEKFIGEKVNVSFATIRRIRRGIVVPSVKTVVAICNSIHPPTLPSDFAIHLMKEAHRVVSERVGGKKTEFGGKVSYKELPKKEVEETAGDLVKRILGTETHYTSLENLGIDNLIIRTGKIIETLRHIKVEAEEMEREYTSWLTNLTKSCGKIVEMRRELRNIIFSGPKE